MIHQPLGGAQGQATEIEIAARHILDTRQRLNSILAERTGQPIEVIERDTDRDNYMTAEQAKEYGLIDEVMENSSALIKKWKQRQSLFPFYFSMYPRNSSSVTLSSKICSPMMIVGTN